MGSNFPYVFVACPCTDPASEPSSISQPRVAHINAPAESTLGQRSREETEDHTFDPRAFRSRFRLYLTDNLLYCEDCHEIRCSRCVIDENSCWFCPNCLVDYPRGHGSLTPAGSRCERMCFQCPICMSPAIVCPVGVKGKPHQILLCTYCNWDSSESNVKPEEAGSIKVALENVTVDGKYRLPLVDVARHIGATKRKIAKGEKTNLSIEWLESCLENQLPDRGERFSLLRDFLSNQIAQTGASLNDLDHALNFASPGSISRIIGLFTNLGGGMKKPKLDTMRDAQTRSEGFQPVLDEDQQIQDLKASGWTGTLGIDQQRTASTNSRFVSHARPSMPVLRARRSRRCRQCKHILVKPESKSQSTRFRIKLVAANYIPTITIRALQPDKINFEKITPLRPFHIVLTMRNPLFDPVKVTLATPSRTPGRFASKVTILCPQFEIGPNTDAWDEALSVSGSKEKRRTRAEASDGQAEAGKIWEQGRNWTSVIIEITPASIAPPPKLGEQTEPKDVLRIAEDEDALEIPLFVRIEYEAEAHGDDAPTSSHTVGDKVEKEHRELAYWTVIGVGKITSK